MARAGQSMSLNYIVVALLLLVAAASIIAYFMGFIGNTSDVNDAQLTEAERQQIVNDCEREKRQICQAQGSGTNWYTQASYDNGDCPGGDCSCESWYDLMGRSYSSC